MNDIEKSFGDLVFNNKVMKELLTSEQYSSLQKTINNGEPLDSSLANEVAEAMKNWAISKGATHYTHWFQPLTGITAEKHEAFLNYDSNGKPLLSLSGKELIKGEPDASSFPNGGLRTTFEARGYTTWDPTSFAFIKGKSLCIPTAFCSYSGEALDMKVPLLRSMSALNVGALRLLKALGEENVKHVSSSVGAEQEYFLIDKKLFDARLDLKTTGRTLFGAKPPKGQELDDHFFGSIKPRVADFMDDLNRRLWRLGIYAKTQHNEVAPSQHELACIYETSNASCDHNQLVMETMQNTAHEHDFVALFHEKPFEGVNGSGKHNNWSISTNTGKNLLSPGETPFDNKIFLAFLCAVIKAVDKYQDLLRISVATASNDHRLGANEAPPAVVSIFLGDELTDILFAIENDKSSYKQEKKYLNLGASVLPVFKKDNTDRNRTSPFAFTGNKFEFRMLGSMSSIAESNVVINTIVAEIATEFAERLEKASNVNEELHNIIKNTVKEHKRIIFNGNGYDESWLEEANKRGLLNRPTTPDCLKDLLLKKNIEVFEKHGVYKESELRSRLDVDSENYCKTVLIEAETMEFMVRRNIIPAVESYVGDLAKTAKNKLKVMPSINVNYEKTIIEKLSNLVNSMYLEAEKLSELVKESKTYKDGLTCAFFIKNNVIPSMKELRKSADEAEINVEKGRWPFPTYEELFFSEQ